MDNDSHTVTTTQSKSEWEGMGPKPHKRRCANANVRSRDDDVSNPYALSSRPEPTGDAVGTKQKTFLLSNRLLRHKRSVRLLLILVVLLVLAFEIHRREEERKEIEKNSKEDAKYRPPWPLPTQWKWYEYSLLFGNERNNRCDECKQSNDARKLLIGHYSGVGDKYEMMLDIASTTSKAYGRRWGVDVLKMKGVALGPAPEFAGANKIEIIQTAMDASAQYDTLFLLDADAIIIDLDLDFLSLIQDKMLAAHRVNQSHAIHTWDVNNGVTLWNLKHPKTKQIVDEWKDRWLQRVDTHHDKWISDQDPMQELLKEKSDEERSHMIHSMASPDGSLGRDADHIAVKHFKRSAMFDWAGGENIERSLKLRTAKNEVCKRFHPFCEEPRT
mmetsp:Transcript_13614/g.19838  ORF Transcript_13614/g.19838 Transcript_13614/m.19838 type:complete len:386 (+) Transcript_13614:119-1276(+)